MRDDLFVPTAEAAFIAGISDREMNRAVDEHILPGSLIRSDNGRRFARLAAALASFYFKTEDVYVSTLRRRVVLELTDRIRRRTGELEAILTLHSDLLGDINWRIDVRPEAFDAVVSVDVGTFVFEAKRRVEEIDRAQELITADPDVMGGLPVFAGTRVPIETVLASLNKGLDRKRLFELYPALTDEHIEAAKVYMDVHPRRGRPSKASRAPTSWKIKSSRRVSPRDS